MSPLAISVEEGQAAGDAVIIIFIFPFFDVANKEDEWKGLDKTEAVCSISCSNSFLKTK